MRSFKADAAYTSNSYYYMYPTKFHKPSLVLGSAFKVLTDLLDLTYELAMVEVTCIVSMRRARQDPTQRLACWLLLLQLLLELYVPTNQLILRADMIHNAVSSRA